MVPANWRAMRTGPASRPWQPKSRWSSRGGGASRLRCHRPQHLDTNRFGELALVFGETWRRLHCVVARVRQVDRGIGLDAPGTGGEHDDAIGHEDRLVDVVSDE